MRTFLSLAALSLAAVPAAAQQDAGPASVVSLPVDSSSTAVFRNNVAGDLNGDGLVDLFLNRDDAALWMPNAGYVISSQELNTAIADLVRVRLDDPLPYGDFGDLPVGASNGAITQAGRKQFLGENYGIATVSPAGVELIELNAAGVPSSTMIDSSVTGAHLVTNGDVDGDLRRDIIVFEHDGFSTDVHIYLQTASGWTTGNTFTIPYVVEDATNTNFDGNTGTEVVVTFDGGCTVYLTGHGGVGSAGDEAFSRIIPGFTNVQVESLPGYGFPGKGGFLWSGLINGTTVLAPLSLAHYQPATMFSGISMKRLEVGHINDDDELDVVFTNAGDNDLYVLMGQPYAAGSYLYKFDTDPNSPYTKTLKLPAAVTANSQSKPLIQDLDDDGTAEVILGLDATNEVVIFEGGFANIPLASASITPANWDFDDAQDAHWMNTQDSAVPAPSSETSELGLALTWTDTVFDMTGGVEVAVFAQEDVGKAVFNEAIEGCDNVALSGAGQGTAVIEFLDDPTPVSSYSAHSTNPSTEGDSNDWGGTDQVLHVMVRPNLPNVYGRRPMIIMATGLLENDSWPQLTSRNEFDSQFIEYDPAATELSLRLAYQGIGGASGFPVNGITPYTGAKRIKRSGFGNQTPVKPNNCGDNPNIN